MIRCGLLLGTMIAGVSLGQTAHASFADVKRAFDTGQYFTAARMAFNDANHAENRGEKAMSYAWTTHGLVKAGLDQSALYFFLKTIELQDRPALKKVLELAPRLMDRTGSDLIRMYLSQFTQSAVIMTSDTESESSRCQDKVVTPTSSRPLMKGGVRSPSAPKKNRPKPTSM